MVIVVKPSAIIPDPPGTIDEGHRCVKLSCAKLARGNHVLIDVLEAMAIKNAQLAIHGSIILNHMVMMCVSENIEIPDNFMNQQFLAHALNWNLAKTPKTLQKIVDPTLHDAVAGHFVYPNNDPNQVNPTTRFVIPDGDNDLLGNGWLIDYLVTTHQHSHCHYIKMESVHQRQHCYI
jgi:hypothetical protein